MQVGDVVTITHKAAIYDHKKFRIRGIRILNNEEIAYSLREYNEYIYDDRIGIAIYTHTNPTGPNIFAPLNNVTGLTLVEIATRNVDGKNVTNIDVSWNNLSLEQRSRLSYYRISYSINGGTSYIATHTSYANTFRIPDLIVGNAYTVKIQTVSVEKIVSSGTVSSALTTVGKILPPTAVSNFAVNYNSTTNQLIFSWSPVTDIADLEGYEIRVGGDTWATSSVVDTFITGTEFQTSNYNSGSWTYYIKAIDYSGNYSTNAASDSITITSLSEDNILVRSNEWQKITVLNDHPNFGTTNSKMREDLTTDYDATYYRRTLSLKSEQDWTELDALAYTCQAAEDALLQLDRFTTAQATYTTEVLDLAAQLFGIMRLRYESASEGGSTSLVIQYRQSDDDITWTAYKTFTSADVTTRYLQFRIIMQTSDAEQYMRLLSFEIIFDVPDATDQGKNQAIGASGTTVGFAITFSLAPKTVIATVMNNNVSATPIISNITTTSFDCKIYNKTDTGITGDIAWFAKGAGGRV